MLALLQTHRAGHACRISGPAVLLVAVIALAAAWPSAAQTPASLALDSVFYGDNTEFRGPFRSGGTVLGSLQRLVFEMRPSDRAVVQFGVYSLERAGSHSPVDKVLPIVSVRLGTARRRFVMGTLDTGDGHRPLGPDRTTPHGLLPPLSLETQWFTRAYEAGLQSLVSTPRYGHDIWFDYQVANNAVHREKFDTGAIGRLLVGGPVTVVYQAHVVHHGGQQFDIGAVSDSLALAPGLLLQGPIGRLPSASLEVYGLVAVDRPNRAIPAATIEGKAGFVRFAAEGRGWRGHVIVWRGDDFNHEDGDANYLSRRPDGSRYRKTRDYSEAGLTRLFHFADNVDLEGSARLHHIDSYFAYSYRLLATVRLSLWHGTIGP